MKLTEIRVVVREEEAGKLADALRVMLERAWPEVVVLVGKRGKA